VPVAASRRPVRPSMGFRGASRTRVRRTRTVIGSVRPVRRFYALRVVILRTSPRPEGRRSALLALSRPYEDVSLQPHTAASCCRCPEGNPQPTCPAMLPLLSFRALRHNPRPAVALDDATDPSVATSHVRGLATPFATSTTGPPGALGAGASLGFALQGVPLVHERCPFRGPCPPDVADRHNPPRGAGRERSPSGPLSRDESVLSSVFPRGKLRPSMPSWASPLQSLLPIRPGHRL